MTDLHPHATPIRRVLIAGAGTAGRSLASDVAASGDIVLGFVDDRVIESDVLGTLTQIPEIASRLQADAVYIAIPSGSAELLREVIGRVPRDLEVAIVPRTYRIVSRERVSVQDLTDVDVLDLVGRAPIKHDMMEARDAIEGRRIMVTGAAGSIGSRIVAQLEALGPELVIGVDRAESGMFHLGQSLSGHSGVRLEIGDVQSEVRMRQLIEREKPHMVFHVAAYKHVPLMQANPIEAFNNNVGGTLNVLKAAAGGGVDRLVYVSTDKAVNPTNVMGATKRIGELLLRDLASTGTATTFTGVRFGNVLESEGSVMQTFRRQLLHGLNLTVTDPEVTRYFMTIDEASQLVIQTATRGDAGDLFVLDMGEPIRVVDLAQGLIDSVNPSLGIDIIGMRPGEKMYEELSYGASDVDSTTHPKIFVIKEDHPADGSTIDWAESMLSRTRAYRISDSELTDELRRFGFVDLR